MIKELNERIAKYINSKDIQRYLIDIGYDFSTTQAAFLISQNAKLSIHEKHKEFEWLMSICEDEIVTEDVLPERKYLGPISLFKLIKEYISTEDKVLSEFYKKEEKAVYLYHWSGDLGWYSNEDCVFSNTEALFDFLDEDDFTNKLYVKKRYIDSKKYIEVCFDPESRSVLSCWTSREDLDQESDSLITFEMMWFDFPVPFKPGDILCSSKWEGRYGLCSGPMCCYDTTYGLCQRKPKYHGFDFSDMNVWGYYCWDTGVMYYEANHGLLDMEYYDVSKNPGIQSNVLLNYSRYLKGLISEDEMMENYKKLIRDNAEKSFVSSYEELSAEYLGG